MLEVDILLAMAVAWAIMLIGLALFGALNDIGMTVAVGSAMLMALVAGCFLLRDLLRDRRAAKLERQRQKLRDKLDGVRTRTTRRGFR